MKFARRTNGIPGVAGRPEPRLLAADADAVPYYKDPSATIKEVGDRVGVSVGCRCGQFAVLAAGRMAVTSAGTVCTTQVWASSWAVCGSGCWAHCYCYYWHGKCNIWQVVLHSLGGVCPTIRTPAPQSRRWGCSMHYSTILHSLSHTLSLT